LKISKIAFSDRVNALVGGGWVEIWGWGVQSTGFLFSDTALSSTKLLQTTHGISPFFGR
jgi:hypothetical protein